MLLLKACPHCHGDLVYEQDRACGYLICVQCGYVLSTAQERALGYRVTALGALRTRSGSHSTQRPRKPTRPRSTSACRPRASDSARRSNLRLVETSAR
jgi:hypothetical protein